ncbi:MAG TPA: hypothetical protein VJT82_07525, partial [Pyrinomonadaceae bacterium]|nr:hypothetical protein [Pyrinomonadaceae bacterium]
MSKQEEIETRGAEAMEAAETADAQPLEYALRESLPEVRSATERRTLAGLAREIGKLPADRARVALELGAQLAALSLRVGLEFLRASVVAARSLEAEELRGWGELGRRLAMADVETGANFFDAGVADLLEVPPGARPLLFKVCERQMTLSTSIATETFKRAPELARAVGDSQSLTAVYEVAFEIARRSAKHSADFLAATPAA